MRDEGQRNNGIGECGLVWRNPETDTCGCLSHNPNTDLQINLAHMGKIGCTQLALKGTDNFCIEKKNRITGFC